MRMSDWSSEVCSSDLVVLTGLYQEDDTGSTSQFLPIVGTFRPNPANPGGRLDPYTFVGKAGWDRYNGRSLQGGGSITHRFSDNIRLSVKEIGRASCRERVCQYV